MEFVGLRSKCYAMKLRKENGNFIEKKVCKGIGKVAIKNRLKFAEYKKCLFEGDEIRHNFTSILSQKQKLFTVIRNKKALSRFDSKRWLFQCGIHSVPFNSILIKKYGNKCFKCKNWFIWIIPNKEKFIIFTLLYILIIICTPYLCVNVEKWHNRYYLTTIR